MAAQGSQGKSRGKGERGETCNPRTKMQHGKITRFKTSIKGRDKVRGKKEEKREETLDRCGTGFIKTAATSRERRLNNACGFFFNLNLYYSLTNFRETQPISVYPTSVHPKIARRRELIALGAYIIQGTVCR